MKKIIILISVTLLLLIIIISQIILLAKGNNNFKKEQKKFTYDYPSVFRNSKPSLYPVNKMSTNEDNGFTGAKDEITQTKIIDSINQEFKLRSKLPLKNERFMIDYDYQEEIFSVFLLEPKDETRKIFYQWLENNYPLIPMERIKLR